MPGYDWRTSGESAGGTSYPVSKPSHHPPSQPPDRNQGGPPSVLNPPPKVTAPPVKTGIANIKAQAEAAKTDPKILADIAASTVSQPTTSFVDNTTPYNTDNPYYPTGNIATSQLLPEQKPLTQPSKFMLANVIADEISKNPKYGKAFSPQHPLGKIIAVDSRGNPIMDSSGNPIYTTFGKKVVDKVYESWDPDNPIDITQPGAFEEHFANFEELDKYERDFWREEEARRAGEKGRERYGRRYGPRSQRDRNLALLQFLQGGSPIKQLEKSGFMGSMESAYQDAPETLQKGLFSKIIPGGAFNPEAMKRLVTSWGSGYTNPRYANVAARGGIMSAWNNMRR